MAWDDMTERSKFSKWPGFGFNLKYTKHPKLRRRATFPRYVLAVRCGMIFGPIVAAICYINIIYSSIEWYQRFKYKYRYKIWGA